jgi:hypothetical protein
MLLTDFQGSIRRRGWHQQEALLPADSSRVFRMVSSYRDDTVTSLAAVTGPTAFVWSEGEAKQRDTNATAPDPVHFPTEWKFRRLAVFPPSLAALQAAENQSAHCAKIMMPADQLADIIVRNAIERMSTLDQILSLHRSSQSNEAFRGFLYFVVWASVCDIAVCVPNLRRVVSC